LSRNLYLNVDIIDPKNISIKFKKYNVIEIKKYLEKINIRTDIIERYITSITENFDNYTMSIKYYNNNNPKISNTDEWIKVHKKRLISG
jgi:hypothetical protein